MSWPAESLIVQNVQVNLKLRTIQMLLFIPTELMTTNKSLRTDENVQGNLLHNYEQKNRKSSISSSIDQTMLQCRYHEDRGDRTLLHDPRRCGTGKLGFSCREYTLRQDDKLSKIKGWIRWNTKIGPALEGAVSHQGRYGIEIRRRLTEEIHIDYIGESTGNIKTDAFFSNEYVTT